jgi:hypothetical protein
MRGGLFIIRLNFKNVEQASFPGGDVEVSIRYPTRQYERFESKIPPLAPGKDHWTGWKGPFSAFAEGYALVWVSQIASSIPIVFVNSKGTQLHAVHGIHVEMKRDIYTFYALVATAISLAGLAVEKMASTNWALGLLMLLVFLFLVVVEPP